MATGRARRPPLLHACTPPWPTLAPQPSMPRAVNSGRVRPPKTLHHALRRMAGLFPFWFWVLAGACQRHGVGGFKKSLIHHQAEIQVTHIEQIPFSDRILKTRLPKPSKVALFASIRGQHATVRIKIKVHSRRSWRGLRRAAAGCGGLRRAAAGCGELRRVRGSGLFSLSM